MSGEIPWPFRAAGEDAQSVTSAGGDIGRWVKGRGTYMASQTGSVVELTAQGSLPSFNMEAKLVQSQLTIFPPEFALLFFQPEVRLPAFKPFQVSTTFVAAEAIAELVVYDADGQHRVPVQAAPK
ncbi:hypothetical protein [Salinarimonas chemoclinalis]|uniref:hypothetical protein n=1 Tax=Salinarimonas chemoclinalis TaxID=3241599 RepID=UPI0035571CA3